MAPKRFYCKKSGRVDGSWNTWRWCFFWATKKEIHIRCRMKLQYLHLRHSEKQNRIRKTKEQAISWVEKKQPFLHGLVHSQWSTIAKHRTALMIIAFSMWFMVDKSRVQSISNWGYFYIPPTNHLLLIVRNFYHLVPREHITIHGIYHINWWARFFVTKEIRDPQIDSDVLQFPCIISDLFFGCFTGPRLSPQWDDQIPQHGFFGYQTSPM